MTETILVTGGCGFIGSHLVDRLVADGHRVRVLDSLDPQIHGTEASLARNPGAEYLRGDIADEELLGRALEGAEAVVHLAASVGVGQSMYEIRGYVRANSLGTAALLDVAVNRHRGKLRKLLVASSMSVYGEGAYDCARCGRAPAIRRPERLRTGAWEPECARCCAELTPAPTPESHEPRPSSVYALTKLDQERLCLIVGEAYGIPTVALRLFNVYGPGQALSNPYTGVVAIFSSRIRAGRPPMVYEDGNQLRDFVSVHDVVRAIRLALASDAADGRVLNVASGRTVSVAGLARVLLRLYGREGELEPEVSGRFRQGDIRHCFADISAVRGLGYEPRVGLEEGLGELAEWAAEQEVDDRFDVALGELAEKGLV
jgi:dTDP-L-rhamnose 4-epimerase